MRPRTGPWRSVAAAREAAGRALRGLPGPRVASSRPVLETPEPPGGEGWGPSAHPGRLVTEAQVEDLLQELRVAVPQPLEALGEVLAVAEVRVEVGLEIQTWPRRPSACRCGCSRRARRRGGSCEPCAGSAPRPSSRDSAGPVRRPIFFVRGPTSPARRDVGDAGGQVVHEGSHRADLHALVPRTPTVSSRPSMYSSHRAPVPTVSCT